jgi:protein phosphatase
VAAAIAVATIAQVAEQTGPSETLLARAFMEARERVLAEGVKNPLHGNMGAVATALRFEDNGRFIGVAHVGDTRLYRVDKRGVRALTTDHVQPLPDQPHRQAVARDLGRKQMQEGWVESSRYAVGMGDLLVLCSDGLYGPVEPTELETTLVAIHQRKMDADSAAQKLVALALARGGPDNVTVIVIRVGRFRRGRRVPRLTAALAMPVLLLLIGLASVTGIWGGLRKRPTTVPRLVDKDLTLKTAEATTLGPGAKTTIGAGRMLDIRGAEIHGASWTIHLEKGAHLRTDRVALGIDGDLRVELEPGADASFVDTHLVAGTLTLVRLPGSQDDAPPRVSLLRVISQVGSLSVEGQLTPSAVEVYGAGLEPLSPAPPPGEPGPTVPVPTAPVPGPGAAP